MFRQRRESNGLNDPGQTGKNAPCHGKPHPRSTLATPESPTLHTHRAVGHTRLARADSIGGKLGSRTASRSESVLCPRVPSLRRTPTRPHLHFPQARLVSGTLPETSQPSTAPPRTRRGVPAASADANHLDEVLTRRRLNVIGDWRWGESNPRPIADPEFFSERSLRFYFSAPSIAQTHRWIGSVSEVSEPPH